MVRDDLAKVEQEIARQTGATSEPVAEIARYLLGGGGKRLRPAMLLLSAGYAGYSGPSAIHLGAVVELIHSATLIHDDVIDGADTRRGRPSANSRWGNHRSVLAGDWMYMQSFRMALQERNFAVLDILIDLTQNMVDGELAQLSSLGRMDLQRKRSGRPGRSQDRVSFQRMRPPRRRAGTPAGGRRGSHGRIRPQHRRGFSTGGRRA